MALDFQIKCGDGICASSEFIKEEEGVEFYALKVSAVSADKPESVSFKFSLDAEGAFSVWNSECGFERLIRPNWKKGGVESKISSGMPTQQLISSNGTNAVNVAVSDVVSMVSIKSGYIEETCKTEFKIEICSIFNNYETVLRIDLRSVPYVKALNDVHRWWYGVCGYKEAAVPLAAKEPVYSLWYSFHQNIDVDSVVEQCKLSKELGIETVIVDDGWQTEDNNRGYAYCGDWNVSGQKIPCGMKEFVKRVHNAGLKFLLWYSVPFVGKYTKAYKKFEGKIIDYNGDYGSLDPRYREVREYITEIYRRALVEWDLDGFKLDFIDFFFYPGANDVMADGRDCDSVEEAVAILLMNIRKSLSEIKPDIMIEFRQPYVGPVTSSCGNMFRVADCPGDALRNRIGVVDIRLTSGSIPAHSDMLMWSMEESAETAALQIINVLFAVPQISVMIDKLSDEHYRMLKFYINFWKSNSDVLLDGKLSAENPEANYSLVSAEKDNRIVVATFSKNLFCAEKDYDFAKLVNGTGKSGIAVLKRCRSEYEYIIYNCMGETVENGVFSENENIKEFDVPASGVVELKKIRAVM